MIPLCALSVGQQVRLLRPAATITNLESLAYNLFKDGLAPSTTQTYSARQQKFHHFCKSIRHLPVPTTENTLILFATYLAASSMSHTTIRVYLATIRQLHVSAGLHKQFSLQLTPRLRQVLRGIRKHQAISHPTRTRLPITIEITQKIKEALSSEPY